MAAAAKKILVAKDGFICQVEGAEYLIKQGERLSSAHPVCKAHPELFEPAQEAAA